MTTTCIESHGDPSWSDAEQDRFMDSLVSSPRSLLDADPETLTTHGHLELLTEIQRAQARLAALEARALAVATGRHQRRRIVSVVDVESDRSVDVVIADELREEIAAALRLSPGQVYDRMVVARLLSVALPETAGALADGSVTAQHVRVVVEQARRLEGFALVASQDPSVDTLAEEGVRADFLSGCRELERRVLPVALNSTPGRTRSAARRAIAAIDAAGEERRRQQARRAIDVHLSALDDGLALLEAWLPAEQAARVHAAIDAQARSASPTGASTLGQLRAQALVDAVCGGAGATVVRTEVQVTIDLASLLGYQDQPGTVRPTTGAEHVVTASAVRELLDDPNVPVSLRRLVTDPLTGSLIDRGRRAYAASAELRAFLVARDSTCRFPGCGRAATRSQIDHAVAWSDGGATDRDNLGHLCTRHHQLKTLGDWDILESRADGSCSWRSPTGRRYDVDPPPV